MTLMTVKFDLDKTHKLTQLVPRGTTTEVPKTVRQNEQTSSIR